MTSEFGVGHKERYRRAMKVHVCCECKASIKAGDHYYHLTGIWESGPDTFKTCIPCRDLRSWMLRDCYDRGEEDWPSLGDLSNTVTEWREAGRVFPEKHRAHAASIDVVRHGQSRETRGKNSTSETTTDLALDAETIHVDGGDSERSF
jgi:hypothetical protein